MQFEGSGNGYVSFDKVHESPGLFSSYDPTPEYFDDVSEDNVCVSADESAKMASHFLGQFSRNGDLEEYLEDMGEMSMSESDVDSLGGALVLEFDVMAYDGQQHVHRYEGKVAREALEYLAEESEWSQHVYYLEGEDMMFIRSNP